MINRITFLLLFVSSLAYSQVVIDSYRFDSVLPLPLAGNANGEDVTTSLSMDNTYTTDPIENGTADNSINTATNVTWAIVTTFSTGDVYGVDESIEVQGDITTSCFLQYNLKLINGEVYEYAWGIYQEVGTGGRVSGGFGTTGFTTLTATLTGEWEYFEGEFTANAANSQFNMYGVDGTGSSGDTSHYHFQIKQKED